MKLKGKFFLYLLYLAFLCCLLPVVYYKYKHPAYNFDMLGYMALIVRLDNSQNIEEIHRVVYNEAERTIPSEEYKRLTDTLAYRKRFAADPKAFEQVLPNYIVKPLYTWLSWVFYKAGFSLVASTVIPSLIAYLCIGLFLFHWLRKYLNNGMAFPAGILIMFSMLTVSIAGLSTPDCLAALFFFIATYFILEKPNLAWMSFFFLLAIFARVDNVITCFFILSLLTFINKWKRITRSQYVLMLVVLGVAYICIMLPVRQFGWSVFYYNQYSKHIDYSRDFEQAVSASSYIKLVYTKLVTALVSTHFTIFLFLSLLIIGNPVKSFRRLTFDQAFLLLLLSVLLFRFILLPDLSDRFYFGFYLVIIVLLVRKLSLQHSTVSYEDR